MCQSVVHVWGTSSAFDGHVLRELAACCHGLPLLRCSGAFFLFVAHCHCEEKTDVKINRKRYINIYIEKSYKKIWKLYCECDLVTMRTSLLKCSSDILVPFGDENGVSFYIPFSDWQELSTGTGSDISKPFEFWGDNCEVRNLEVKAKKEKRKLKKTTIG